MAESGVDVEGMAQALSDIRRWTDQLSEDLPRNERMFADLVRSQVADKVPVLTGTLAGSTEVIPEPNGFGVGIGEGVPYAGWIEYGGSRGRDLVSQGRYLYPTALENEPQFQQVAERAATTSISEFHWSTPS